MRQTITIEILQFLTLHQQVLHTSLKISRTKRLGDIIIRPIFQSFQFTFYRRLGSKQYDRNMAGRHIRTKFTRHFDTVFLRHHDVADNNIRQILQSLAPSLHTVGSLYHPIS